MKGHLSLINKCWSKGFENILNFAEESDNNGRANEKCVRSKHNHNGSYKNGNYSRTVSIDPNAIVYLAENLFLLTKSFSFQFERSLSNCFLFY